MGTVSFFRDVAGVTKGGFAHAAVLGGLPKGAKDMNLMRVQLLAGGFLDEGDGEFRKFHFCSGFQRVENGLIGPGSFPVMP